MAKRTEHAANTIKNMVAPDAMAVQQSGKADAPLGTSNNPSHAVFTLANLITFCRFLLTVAFLVLFVRNTPDSRTIALICYAVAACTDFLDGQVARRTQTVSWVGKIMDPIMDRVLLFTGVFGLMVTGELPIWVAVIVVGRDIVLGVGSFVLLKYQTRPLDVIYIGKIATALLMSGFVDLLLSLPKVPALNLVPFSWLPGFNGQSAALGIYLVYAGLVCSIITAVIYLKTGFAIRRKVLDAREEGRES